MSVTITLGGVTMTGAGVTLSAAPPPSTPTAGWISGGLTSPPTVYSSSVNRITFATDTGTASVRGPLTVGRFKGTGAGTVDYGWIAGGYSPTIMSSVDRITYATDTATASLRGPLSSIRQALSATGNTTDGWFGGGAPGPGTTVDKITYATDTATASVKGSLSVACGYTGAATGTTSYGWFGGGYTAGSPVVSTVQRIDYANDTAATSIRGTLSLARYSFAAVTDTTYGWFGGGYTTPSAVTSLIDRITYATDTATASVRGPLSAPRALSGGLTDNSLYGWFVSGGTTVGVKSSTIARITYATDTATASVRGPLASTNYGGLGGTSGVQ